MALDFPNAPTNGQTYTGPNGVIWTWDGAKWANGTVAGAYAPVLSPVFTGDPKAPTPSPGDSDTSVATTAFVQSAVSPAFNGTGRNLLHNPLFNVAQRGAGLWTTTGYTADRWQVYANLDTMSAGLGGVGDAGRAQIGDEAAITYISNTFTGNAGAAAQSFLDQPIEGVRRLSGKTVTISFWVISSSATLKTAVNLFQVFGTGGSPSSPVQVLTTGNSLPTTTSWARVSTTIAIPSAAGKTFGTTAGTDYTLLRIYYSSGATANAESGNIGVQSGAISIWGVQLEIGSVATPLEKPDPRYDLANCQRFYQTGIEFRSYLYSSTAGVQVANTLALPVTMRASPTVVPTFIINNNATGPTMFGMPGAVWMYANATIGSNVQLSATFTASADL